MKKFKKFLAVFMVLVFACILVAGCSSEKKEEEKKDTDTGEKKEILVHYSDCAMDQTRKVIYDSMVERVDYINETRDDVHVKLTYSDAQDKIDKQIADIETAMLTEPDALILSAVDSDGVMPIVTEAHNKGIKIVDMRDLKNKEVDDCVFWGADEGSYAKGMKEWIKAYFEKNPDEVWNVGLIYGLATQTPQLERCDLMVELAKEMPDKIKILDSKYGDWLTDKAMSITEDWLQAYPEMNVIWCANDIMALGASNVVISANKTGEIIISGVDLTDEGIDRIKEGTMSVDVGSLMQDYGLIMDAAVATVMGEFEPEQFTPEGCPLWPPNEVYVVDGANVDEFLKIRKEKVGY